MLHLRYAADNSDITYRHTGLGFVVLRLRHNTGGRMVLLWGPGDALQTACVFASVTNMLKRLLFIYIICYYRFFVYFLWKPACLE